MRDRDVVVESVSLGVFGKPVTGVRFLKSGHGFLGSRGSDAGDAFLFKIAVNLNAVTSATAVGIDVVVSVGEVGVAEPEIFARSGGVVDGTHWFSHEGKFLLQ